MFQSGFPFDQADQMESQCMDENIKESLVGYLSVLPDPRIERSRRHNLVGILVIAVCAVICGAESWTDIEDFGNSKVDWLREFLAIPSGIPSHDTFRQRAFGKCWDGSHKPGRHFGFQERDTDLHPQPLLAIHALDVLPWQGTEVDRYQFECPS